MIARNCHDLKRIDLSDNRNITNEGVSQLLQHNQNLLSLSLCNTNIDYTAFEVLEKQQRPNLHNINLMSVPVNGLGLRIIGTAFPKLNSIDLYSNSFFDDDDLLAVIQGCPDMNEFRMQFCVSITDVTMKNIAMFGRNTTVVDVYGCQQYEKNLS